MKNQSIEFTSFFFIVLFVNLFAAIAVRAGAVRAGAVRAGDEPATRPAARTMKLHVIDATTSQPVANAKVTVFTNNHDPTDTLVTDKNGGGQPSFNLENSWLLFRVDRDGYVPTQVMWNWYEPQVGHTAHGAADLPEEFELKLPPGVEINGQVTDDGNTPIAGVAIMMFFTSADRDMTRWPAVDIANEKLGATTDAEGRWHTTRASATARQPRVCFGHSDYILETRYGKDAESVKLSAGVRLPGKVTDTDGHPIPGAMVYCYDTVRFDGTGPNFTNRADAEGDYMLGALPPGEHYMAVIASGYQRKEANVDVKPNARFDVKLEKGLVLHGKVVDRAGQPLQGVNITLLSVSEIPGPDTRGATDAGGEFSFDTCPNAPVQIQFSADGFAPLTTMLKPGAENTVTLSRIDEPATTPAATPSK